MDDVQVMQVAHATSPTFGMKLPNRSHPKFPKDYVIVALVEVVEGEEADANTAFELTNHIDHPWWENDFVTLVGEPTHRSTSVGDAVAMPDGRVLICANTGWTELKAC